MSSSAFPIISAIFALFCSSLISISASKNSSAPIYVRYVRRRPPWFPGDLYVEDVVEEFRTKSKPPMFGSSEIEIQQFLEKDQKLQEAEAQAALGAEVKTNSSSSVKGEKRKIGTLRQVKRPPIVELKPTITVTVYKPSNSLEMRVNEFATTPVPCTTTMKVPYTKVIMDSAEIDYYDVDEGWSYIPASTTTTTTTTQRSVWKLFGTTTMLPTTTTTAKAPWTLFEPSKSETATSSSKTTTTAKTTWTLFEPSKSETATSGPKTTSTTTTTAKTPWTLFEPSKLETATSSSKTTTTAKTTWTLFEPSKSETATSGPKTTSTTTTTTTPKSFWPNFGQTKSTSTTTTEKPIESTVSAATTTQRTYGLFNLFGKSTTSTTTETPTTTTTESFEEPTTTEFVSTFPDSAEEDKTTTTEIGTLDNLSESLEVITSLPTTESSSESVIKNLDDDYVNGEVVDSIEEDHTETSLNTDSPVKEESEEVTTTTKKTKLFSWFG